MATAIEIFLGIVEFVVIVGVVLIVYKIITGYLQRAEKKRDFPADAVNGIKLMLRVILVTAIVVAFFTLVELPESLLISISSVSGIIIGFASTEVISQVVSGIYIISAQPFGVTDLIRVGSMDGLVVEIGVNSVLLQRFDGCMVRIPNKRILDSEILNYTVSIEEELDKQGERRDSKVEEVSRLRKVLGDLGDFLHDNKVTRYTFEIEVDVDTDPASLIERLDRICQEFEPVFEYRPKYFLKKLSIRAIIQVKIYCRSSYKVLQNRDNLLETIAEAVWEEEG